MQVELRRDPPQGSRWKGLVAGGLGGLVGSLAMSQFSSLFSRTEDRSQSAGEDSTVKTASAISETIFHHRLTARQKPKAGVAVHYAFGAAMGALYGMLAGRRNSTQLGWGLPLGAAVWLGAHVITVPALDLSEPVTRNSPDAEGIELAAHLVYGAVAEGVRRSVERYLLR